jgi:spore germination cell wall hydrolase CwlJ-like protein
VYKKLLSAVAATSAMLLAASPASAAEDVAVSSVNVSADLQDSEHGCLTEAIYREAGSEPHRGRLAVAEVILNRTRSGIFPRTVCGVTHQRGQFTFPKGLGPRRGNAEARLWDEAKAIALQALSGATARLSSSTYYFRPARHAVAGSRLVAVIGRHAFYAAR